MNETQRKTLLATAAVVALMIIFPPYEVKTLKGITLRNGYGFLFDLHNHLINYNYYVPSVNVKILFIQIFGAVVVAGMVFLANNKPATCAHPVALTTKSPAEMRQEEMRRLDPILFPGGREQIVSAGKSISSLLNHKISPDVAAKIYSTTKYLAHTVPDSKQSIVSLIVRQSDSIISASEASMLYDRFIRTPPISVPAGANSKTSPDVMFINTDIEGIKYRLQNSNRSIAIDAPGFTAILLGLRSEGWHGASSLFDSAGYAAVLKGKYSISDADAKELSKLTEGIISRKGCDQEMANLLRPLIELAREGAFTLHA